MVLYDVYKDNPCYPYGPKIQKRGSVESLYVGYLWYGRNLVRGGNVGVLSNLILKHS